MDRYLTIIFLTSIKDTVYETARRDGGRLESIAFGRPGERGARPEAPSKILGQDEHARTVSGHVRILV
jgi:hypothetical protein